MAAFTITGGTPLLGSVRIGGAKNASYKLMIASLLGDTESRLLNFSHISDVQLVGTIIAYLGAEVKQAGERAIFINPSTLAQYTIDETHGEQGRFSTMFIPALLSRFGKAAVPAPGGDKIGKRPLDRHWDGLEALGAKVWIENNQYLASTTGLVGATYRFNKNTHTGTETLLMAAVKAKGKTVLENAAQEPEVDDLIAFLNAMGAKITRLTNRTIEIIGVSQLHGAIHKIMPDRNEAVSYACTALGTGGDVIIENAQQQHLTAFLDKVAEAGGGFECDSYGIRFYSKGPLTATDITTQVHPGFMTDWQPLWATLMTQASGMSTIHETIMESRFQYVADLVKMGVRCEYYQPKVENPEQLYNFDRDSASIDATHAVKIYGKAALKPGEFAVKDLRHGATLISAALIAKGSSVITEIEHVDRGYESLDTRLRSLGARITRK